MEAEQSTKDRVSSAEAVMLGALAPGVNGATWNTLKMAFFMLGICLAAMLGLAFSITDSSLVFHVAFLVLIAATLFLLLCSFLAETGLVTVEHQMQEIGLGTKDAGHSSKNTSSKATETGTSCLLSLRMAKLNFADHHNYREDKTF